MPPGHCRGSLLISCESSAASSADMYYFVARCWLGKQSAFLIAVKHFRPLCRFLWLYCLSRRLKARVYLRPVVCNDVDFVRLASDVDGGMCTFLSQSSAPFHSSEQPSPIAPKAKSVEMIQSRRLLALLLARGTLAAVFHHRVAQNLASLHFGPCMLVFHASRQKSVPSVAMLFLSMPLLADWLSALDVSVRVFGSILFLPFLVSAPSFQFRCDYGHCSRLCFWPWNGRCHVLAAASAIYMPSVGVTTVVSAVSSDQAELHQNSSTSQYS